MLDATSRRRSRLRSVIAPSTHRLPQPVVVDLTDPDLPCPWCGAPTTESDDHCPACHHLFG